MTNSTFKPTHVRCVVGDGGDFTEGNVYLITGWHCGIEPYVLLDDGSESIVYRDEVKRNKKHTAKYPLFRYVGPPAILGDPIND